MQFAFGALLGASSPVELSKNTARRACLMGHVRMVERVDLGAGFEPALTGSESVVLPIGRSQNVLWLVVLLWFQWFSCWWAWKDSNLHHMG